jgi:8-oxo-dGTP pyrophosphatase MutT (NUDIX family)
MARRVDRPRKLRAPARRPPLTREFSAGGLVYRRGANGLEVLLAGRRIAPEGPLLWIIPKGHLEPGESAEAAALREVREETGIDAVLERPLGEITYHFGRRDSGGDPERVFKRVRFFLMRARGGRFSDRDAEMDEVRWVPLAAAAGTLAYENERALVRRAGTLLR